MQLSAALAQDRRAGVQEVLCGYSHVLDRAAHDEGVTVSLGCSISELCAEGAEQIK